MLRFLAPALGTILLVGLLVPAACSFSIIESIATGLLLAHHAGDVAQPADRKESDKGK